MSISGQQSMTSSLGDPNSQFSVISRGGSTIGGGHSSRNVSSLKRCKCFSLGPNEDCYGLPYGIDIMSRGVVKVDSSSRRDRRFQMDLQQHTRRMGWGVPMKHVPKKNSRNIKPRRGKKQGRKQPPILHRASSKHNKVSVSLPNLATYLVPPAYSHCTTQHNTTQHPSS